MPNDPEKIIEEKYVRVDVVEERGRWVVYIEVGNIDTSVKHRIQDYPKKALAELAAKWIKRTAEKQNSFRFNID